MLQVVDAAAVHPTFLRPSLPRLLWSQVLAESKAFAERTIPTLDLVSFGKLCGDVTSLEKLADDSTYSEDQQKSIRDLTKMLASCSDEDSLFEEDADSKAKFLQYIREVSTWFKDFRPPVERVLQPLGTVLSPSLLELEGITDLAECFPPGALKLASNIDSVFMLQCTLTLIPDSLIP